jgi:hypothetical protein
MGCCTSNWCQRETYHDTVFGLVVDNADRAHLQGMPTSEVPKHPGKFRYAPEPPKIPVTQEARTNFQAKDCR